LQLQPNLAKCLNFTEQWAKNLDDNINLYSQLSGEPFRKDNSFAEELILLKIVAYIPHYLCFYNFKDPLIR
jgi:hypothetical protein